LTRLLCVRLVVSSIGAVVVYGVAQVAYLASSPCLVIADVSTRFDRLAIGGDHAALGTRLIGRMSGVLPSLGSHGWRWAVLRIGDHAIGVRMRRG
jgi:hypothetical protein